MQTPPPVHAPLSYPAPPPREHLPRRSWKVCAAASLLIPAASAVAGYFAILPTDWRWIGGIGLVAQGAVIGGIVAIGLELRYLIKLNRLATGELQPTVPPLATPAASDAQLDSSTDWMKRYWTAWDAGRGNPGPAEHRELCQSSANSLTAFLMVPNLTTVSAMVVLATITSIVATLHQKSASGAQGEQLFRLATLTWYECTLLLAASLGVCGFARSIVNRWTTAVMTLAPLPMPSPERKPPPTENLPNDGLSLVGDRAPIAPPIVVPIRAEDEAPIHALAPEVPVEPLPVPPPEEDNPIEDPWAFLALNAANPPAGPPEEPAQ